MEQHEMKTIADNLGQLLADDINYWQAWATLRQYQERRADRGEALSEADANSFYEAEQSIKQKACDKEQQKHGIQHLVFNLMLDQETPFNTLVEEARTEAILRHDELPTLRDFKSIVHYHLGHLELKAEDIVNYTK